MRPLRLDMAGFTVFREPSTVDFTDADFFALTGPTGSGKSTVLDAVCFALYGTVPRWADRRGVASALAPSATEARVRLIFESAGARYVATRVVRRDGKGRVATTHAGLEELPRGFDLGGLDPGADDQQGGPGRGGWLDGTPAEVRLGTVLAGTPAEMDQAVADVIGLPYEQFTRCVLLPQGEFAEFLHARPAARQQILVNLLGLSVYEEIRTLASARAAQADARLVATERMLVDLADATDEAIEEAAASMAAMRQMAGTVDRTVPELRTARQAAIDAHAALADLDAALARLEAVRVPDGVAELAGQADQAAGALARAGADVTAAEEREEKLRGEWSAGPDPVRLRAILDAHADHERLDDELAALSAEAERAENAHRAAQAEVDAAAARAAAATTVASRAEENAEAARSANRAAVLRAHLRAGDPCPVCAQPVGTVPPQSRPPAMEAALAALREARAAAEAAATEVTRLDRQAREHDRAVAKVHARREQVEARAAQVRARLAGAPDARRAAQELDRIEALRRRLDEASDEVRLAREEQRRAAATEARAQQRLRSAWQEFDGTRDAVAAVAAASAATVPGAPGGAPVPDPARPGVAGTQGGPPPVDRDDLLGAWRALAGWAAAQSGARRRARTERAEEVRTAEDTAAAVTDRLAALFATVGVTPPAPGTGADRYAGLAAGAVAQAGARHDRLVERREQAAKLREQRAEHERDGQVARALANHLRANNFERWLLAEALDQLVDGASRILRELSGGQYDLVHSRGEFAVVDHHDAALRRPVRTLSGGETFQASLALALALSEQLGGMSTAAASLESIVLDEGFGTLDPATLDTVAATLEDLAAKGDRMVGLVTHVASLAERIPVRFEVRKDARSARVRRVAS